jgi:hypothetical protein
VIGETAVRTLEGMALPHTTQAAARAIFAGESGVDFGNTHAMLLRFASDALADKAVLPECQTSA